MPIAIPPADQVIEMVLPLEIQVSLFNSLPIAGLVVTPDEIAQWVLMNPSLRADLIPSLSAVPTNSLTP